MFERSISSGAPASTRPQIGLRISLDVRIPPDSGAQEHNNRVPDSRLSLLPSPCYRLCLQSTPKEAEVVRYIKPIQIDEKAGDGEEEDYNAGVAAQVNGMATADSEAMDSPNVLQGRGPAERQGRIKTKSQHSDYMLQEFDAFDLGVQQELSKAWEPIRSTMKLQRSQQNAPRSNDNSNNITPQSASSRKQSRQSKSASFPAQKNTLLS